MERVAFLVERTGERLACLLNPETLVVRRRAGVRARQSVAGTLTGAGLSDDPLLFTGGGSTELELELLFDVNLDGSAVGGESAVEDVRALTAPLWALAENAGDDAGGDGFSSGIAARGYGRLPLIRLVWGKTWNVPAVVAAVAERLEEFTPTGAPQRSWMRMRLLRVAEPPGSRADAAPLANPFAAGLPPTSAALVGTGDEGVEVHETVGGSTETEEGREDTQRPGERIDSIANNYLGSPAGWRWLAAFNDLDDPLRVPAGTLLRIPPRPGQGQPSAGPGEST